MSAKRLNFKRFFQENENRRSVLGLILSEERFSQVEISRVLQISKPTVSHIVRELKEKGIVEETGVVEPNGQSGKRAQILGMKRNGALIIGVWIRGRKVSMRLINLKAETLYSQEMLIEEKDLPDRLPDLLSDSINRLKKSLLEKEPDAEVMATGIIMSGTINPTNGEVINSNAYKMKNFPLGEMIENKTGILTFIDDYPVVSVMREYWAGNARGVENFVLLEVLPYLRAVALLDGRIHYGNNFAAGQIGASLAKMGFKDVKYLQEVVDEDVFGLHGDGSLHKSDEKGAIGDNLINMDRIDEFIDKTRETSEMFPRIDKLARIVAQMMVNFICFYDPKMVVCEGVPEDLQDRFRDELRQELEKSLYGVRPDDYCFHFCETIDNHKEEGILYMVLGKLLRWM